MLLAASAGGARPLGGSGGMVPQKIFEILKLLDAISRILRAVSRKSQPHKKCIIYINFYPTIRLLV